LLRSLAKHESEPRDFGLKICFLSLNSYPALTGKNLGYVGGAEVEQVHLARELLTKGHDVFFITYSQGQEQTENVSGIKIVKTYEREKAGKISAMQKYRLLWSPLRKADADIYFHEAGSYGVLPLFCYMNRKKFVHRIASDAIVLSKPLFGKYSLAEKFRDMLEVKRANVVVAQSRFQKRILEERLKVESVVIKNGLMLPQADCNKPEPPVVLWVGSLSQVKNPELFLELAKSIPNARFEMVGGPTEDHKLFESIKRAVEALPNLKYHGFVPYPKVNDYFKRASIFVSTSRMEGFPNAFIQAWAHYTPVVSLNVDPDNVIQDEQLGLRSGTFKQLVSDVTTLLEYEKLRKTMGYNARKYVEKEHDIRLNVKKYLQVFEEILLE
jgi:glycosyltransferase involved in cell wall biosynthesis